MWWAQLLNNIVALLGNGAGGGGSSYESIATATPTSGSSITFSSIPSTYKHLQVRVLGRWSDTDTRIDLQCNGDTTSKYSYHWLTGDGSAASASGAATQTAVLGVGYVVGTTTSSYIGGAAIIDIHDYASTTNYKTIRSFNGWDSNGNGRIRLSSGSWQNTAAVSSLTLFISGGTYTSGTTFALYGIKG